MADNSDFMEKLQRANLERGEQIQTEIDAKYGKLTERERRLMREAAVASWVAAAREYGVYGAKIPQDADVLNQALWVCHGNEDLYPVFMDYTAEVEDA